MVIELKWNRTPGGAIAQIKRKKYTAVLKPFAGNILLVGINYNEKIVVLLRKHNVLNDTI